MDKIDVRRLQRLFTAATIVLEDTHSIACGGQAAGRTSRAYAQRARQLAKAGDELVTIADKITALLARSKVRRGR